MNSQLSKLVLLGHSDGGVPIVMDVAFESLGIRAFDLVKNLDRPNCPYPDQIYQANFWFDHEYGFEENGALPIQFGVHNSHVKYQVHQYFFQRFNVCKDQYINLIHPKSYIASSAKIGRGNLIEPMTVISSMASIGFGVTLKRSSSIGHHSQLGDFVNVNPGAVLSGYVEVGEGTEIGSGAVVSNNVKIGRSCLIGAGSVVTKDIPDGVIAYGNPCKVVRENERWTNINVGD